MRRASVRQTVASDLFPIAEQMRREDVDEIWASHRHKPLQSLKAGFERGDQCWTIVFDGEPIGMFGVGRATLMSDRGIPWLLATDKLVEIQVIFLKSCKKHVQNMKIGYNILENYVSIHNKTSLRWLKWLGFTIEDKTTTLITGAEFKRFYMEDDQCAAQQ